MLKGITTKSEIKKYRSELKQKLHLIADEEISIRYSSKAGIGPEEYANYSEYYNIWWYFGGKDDQFWNPFGKGRPIDHQPVTGRCQINMPVQGLNRRIAGAFAKDENDRLYLLHSGKIGGGVTGISKKTFISWYPGSAIDVDFDGASLAYLIVAEFHADNFYEQLQFFIDKVYEFKELSSKQIKASIDHSDEDKWLTHGESTLRNPYTLPARTVLRGSNHAMITNELIKVLTASGYDARRNRLIDTFIVRGKNKLSHIFEVKNILNTQTFYTAIGQLMIYGLKHDTIRVMVIDEKSDPVLLKDLASLNILCLLFSWVKKKPKFKDLSVLNKPVKTKNL